MQDIKAFLSNLTHHPGVYQMLDAKNEVLYVGKAKDLKKRVSSYFRQNLVEPKTIALMKCVHHIEVTITRDENEALLLECNLIKKHHPHYNVLLRDDKSYPYIFINTEHPYPRIDVFRGQPKKDGRYFGPYPNVSAVREILSIIQKVFLIRTCHDGFFSNRSRPCLHYQIGLCSGPCTEMISIPDYQRNLQNAMLFLQGKNNEIITEMTMQMDVASKALQYEQAAALRDQITKIRAIQAKQYISSQHGDVDVIGLSMQAGVVSIQLLAVRLGRILGSRAYQPSVPAHSSQDEIISAFITQHYLDQNTHEIPKEIIIPAALVDQTLLAEALSIASKHKVGIASAVRGERKKWLEMATNTAKQTVASQLHDKTKMANRFEHLQAALQLTETPERLECFDISHTMGEATVASCVVFDNQGPAKSLYRRFNITGITPGDDYAAMRQALLRRFKHAGELEHRAPDVLLIDGGLGQLHIAEQVISELQIPNIVLVGVAKGEGRKPGLETLHIPGKKPIHLPTDALALHLIQQIRDEAHRFAITGHRQRRDKKRRTSTLEEIPGIGAKRRRDLLLHFGGIQAINRASLEELAKAPGISLSLAKRIFAAIHNVAE